MDLKKIGGLVLAALLIIGGVILAVKLSREQPSHSALLSTVAELPCVYAVQELIY